MFTKISNDFLDLSIDYSQFNSEIKLDHYYSSARKGGSTFFSLKNIDYFWSIHLKNIFTIKPNVYYAVFTGSGLVTPHTDGGNDTVALNFYLIDHNDSTIFYEKKNKNVNPYPNTRSYDVKQLHEVGRFSAKKYDTYLMDVQTIHGILKSNNSDRIFISYRWKGFTYDQIFNSLKL